MENKNNITEAIKEIITERGISLLEKPCSVLCYVR